MGAGGHGGWSEKIGRIAAFKLAITVPRRPKPRSDKILRGTTKIADGDA